MQIRRQMKALLSEIRVQGDILKNLSVTLALGEGVESLPEIGSSLKNARLLIEERLLAGTGKLMEGSKAGSPSRTVRASQSLMTGSPTRWRVWIPLQ